jgi:exo-beta-1,3-glucanase (GH17 family)
MGALSCTRSGFVRTHRPVLIAWLAAILCSSLATPAQAAVTLSLSPSSVAFGNQTVGTSSAAKTVTVTNSGTTAATVSVSITGTGAAAYKQTNTCTASVAAGKTCSVSVTFAPTAATAYNASVSVSATGATAKTATLTGTGVAATTVTASANPTALTFASTAVGASSAAQSITITNTGTGTLTVSSVSITGTNASAFAQSNTCTAAVAAGKTCSVSVTFKPTATGAASATVSIASNASGSPLSVGLSGTGAAAATSYTLTPTSLTFAAQAVGTASSAQSVTLKNTGSASLTVTTAALSGAQAAGYTLTNGCTAALAANATCVLSVAFKPTATGSATATLTVIAGSVAKTVTLSGTATAAAALRPLPAVYTTGKAVAYSPFRAGGPGVGEVPTDAQILEDLGLLQSAGFNLLRLYGADVNASNILRLIAANYPTMSVQLGVYLEGAPATCVDAVNSAEIATAISLATTYTQVVSVSVGNETSLANNLPVNCLLSYVQQVRAGVTQPITADDTASFYAGTASNGEKPDTVLPYLDFASIHTYPILNPSLWNWQQLTIASSESRGLAMMNAALTFAKGDYASASAHAFTTAAGVKTTVGAAMPIVIGETGWKANWTNPNSAIELYTATVINAKDYWDLLNGWKGTAGGPLNIFYFEAFDEAWKGTDDGWGLWDATRSSRYALCGITADAGACQSPDPYLGLGYYP